MSLKFCTPTKQHYTDMEKLIRETWRYDTFCSPKIAKQLSRYTLYACMAPSTFLNVAIYNEQIVGIILCTYTKQHHFSPYLYYLALQARFQLLLSKEGKHVLKNLKKVDAINDRLIQKSQPEFEAEIIHFTVSDAFQGKGIGNQLYQSALTYFEKNKASNYYLLTDTKCDYTFYDHKNMTCLFEKSTTLTLTKTREKDPITFFLYFKEMSY